MTMIIGALAIGLTLGLLGSGGSILTVPVLVYVLGHDDKAAIAESLAIVAAISSASEARLMSPPKFSMDSFCTATATRLRH